MRRAVPAVLAPAAVAMMGAMALAIAACESDRPRIVIEHDPNLPVAARPEPPSRGPAAAASKPDPTAPIEPAGLADYTLVTGPGYRGYVRPAPGPDHWEPDATDIAALEARLPAAAEEAARRGDIPSADVAGYTRKYIGYLRGGRRFVEIRLYCSGAENLARKNVIVTGGAGCLLFSAYDTETGEFPYFRTRAE